MISAIVFSKDNPARLHLLLESIYKTNGNVFDITVLYECSSQEIVEGYDFTKRYFYYRNKSGFHFPVRWKQRESEKEDRKDERTKIQATQQSQMIEQRKEGGTPKNFESSGNDILGEGIDLSSFAVR